MTQTVGQQSGAAPGAAQVLRTVAAEHGYIGVQCPGEMVGGVMCWRTIGTAKLIVGCGYRTYTAGGTYIGMHDSLADAIASMLPYAV